MLSNEVRLWLIEIASGSSQGIGAVIAERLALVAAVSELGANSAVVDALHELFLANFRFVKTFADLGHHGMSRLRWQGSAPDGLILLTGTDVAKIVDGKITTLHIFLDPAPTTLLKEAASH